MGVLCALAGTAQAERAKVVLDPGHGGSNTGTRGRAVNKLEKHLTLAYARVLKQELEALGVEVLLTRDSDQFLTLRERSEFANRVGANAFVSLHFNATPYRNRRGFETFLLPPRAITTDAPALRGGDPPTVRNATPEIGALLDDIKRGVAHDQSLLLAKAVQARLAEARPGSVNRGIKQNAMHVLLGATMPAVLIEIGFLDHPVEGPQLLTARVRDTVCKKLAQGIAEFVH